MRFWSPLVALLSVGGFTVSLYLTLEHYQKVPLVCPISQVFNCGAVLSSAAATFLGVPTAGLGLVWFAVMFWLALIGRRPEGRPRLRWPVLVWSGLGVLGVFYLVYAELFIADAFCLWCTVAHLLILILLVLNLLAYWEAAD